MLRKRLPFLFLFLSYIFIVGQFVDCESPDATPDPTEPPLPRWEICVRVTVLNSVDRTGIYMALVIPQYSDTSTDSTFKSGFGSTTDSTGFVHFSGTTSFATKPNHTTVTASKDGFSTETYETDKTSLAVTMFLTPN